MISANHANASLVVVGAGIKCISHLTTEAETYVKQSNKVLYLVNNSAMKDWIQKVNSATESLDEIYFRYPFRAQAYQAITDYILNILRMQQQHVCVVLYGHPTVFAKPALDAVKQAKAEGYDARILPGISAEDCLFSDLLIDPGSDGCQSFDATDFLLRRKQFDVNCHLILWQVGVIGALGHYMTHDNAKGVMLLHQYLNQYYDAEHKVIIYEAACYPHCEPVIKEISLALLPHAIFSPISTLYIPPTKTIPLDHQMLQLLNINANDLFIA